MGPKSKKTKKVKPVPSLTGECSISLDQYNDDVGVLKCNHAFCFNCIEEWSKKENTCPLCKERFSFIDRYCIVIPEIASDTKDTTNTHKKTRVKIKRKDLGDNINTNEVPAHGSSGPQTYSYHFILQHLMNNQIFFHDDDDDDDVEDDEYLENREFEDLAFLQLVTQTSTNFIENRRVIDLVNDDDNDIELNSTSAPTVVIDLTADDIEATSNSGNSSSSSLLRGRKRERT